MILIIKNKKGMRTKANHGPHLTELSNLMRLWRIVFHCELKVCSKNGNKAHKTEQQANDHWPPRSCENMGKLVILKRVFPRFKWLWRPCLWWNLILELPPNKFVYILITEKEGCLLLAWICYDTNISNSFKALALANIIRKLWCRHSINNIFSFPRSQARTPVSPCLY